MIRNRIAHLRKRAGLNQADLAEMLNLSASAIGMYEQGRRTPSIEVLIILAEFFNVSLDYLITGSDHIPRSEQTVFNCPCTTCYWKDYNKENSPSPD